jgi:NADH-quinone oxidoreductase subunit L
MFEQLWLIPFLPLIGFILLTVVGSQLSKKMIAIIGVGSVGLSALLALGTGIEFLQSPPPGNAYTQVLWTWIRIASFIPQIAFYLDPLSVVMMLVVTWVSFLIHLYCVEFMADDEGYQRFFAYMNLFVASMLILVLADGLLFLYLGWEGVGLCSYLLIGFWYQDPINGYAARKAFVITRVGDTAMAIGLLLLFTSLGTLNIQLLMERASQEWTIGSSLAVATAGLLLGGALGKSAQLPLQTWLPDAMAGPTPVSALIHAATMVTAGVYLIARTYILFALAPAVLSAVAIIGALTLLLAASSALAQTDIKRILAYSTISQIGYMFLALGVGAWSAAIFHLMIHAFFKALLFLTAGVIILSLHHEHNIFKMGGLRKDLPIAFWSFLIGGASLAALPVITAGFFSKDLILWQAWASPLGNFWLWAAGLLGGLLTAIYIFRAWFVVFYGLPGTTVGKKPGYLMIIPLVVLSVLSLIGGWVELPLTLGGFPFFSEFLRPSLPPIGQITFSPPELAAELELVLEIIAAAAAILGIYLAYLLSLRPSTQPEAPVLMIVQRFWHAGWGFDWLYDRILVRPLLWFTRINRSDFIDSFYQGIIRLAQYCHRGLSQTQTGQVRWYAGGVAIGTIIFIAMAVFL